MSDRFERHARTVTLLTFLSRVTGLGRDAALSRIFGAGDLMSAFFFAFMIPNLFRRLFGEGALAAAFLPLYARLHESDPKRSRALASLTIAWMTIVLGLATLVAELLLIWLAMASDDGSPALWFTAIMLPYMPMVCIVAVLGAMLQVRGRFGPTAASPVLLNVAVIAATLLLLPIFAPRDKAGGFWHVALISASVLVAGVLQLLWTLHALRDSSAGIPWRRRLFPWWSKDPLSARSEGMAMLRMAGPMILSLGVLQLNTFLDGLIASYPVTFQTDRFFGVEYPLDKGAMATLSFAQRLYQFPLGVFGIAVATAIFPLLARQAGDQDAFLGTLRRGLRLVMFIGLPASVGLMLVQRPLTAVIYEGGAFTADESARVAVVLAGYAPAIWAYSMTHVLTRAFYARGDSRSPMRLALAIVSLNLVLNCTLIWWLREAGLAWSTAICACVQVISLLMLFRKHVRGVVDKTVLRSWMHSAVATALMAVLVITLKSVMAEAQMWMQHAMQLSLLVGAGGGTVAIYSILLRMPELWWALGRSVREASGK